jgi:lipid II:glycine glycyltransferase (peptidoglycan interpeptide bridge formation enzyme)
MLTVKTIDFPFNYKQKFFYDRPALVDMMTLTEYTGTKSTNDIIGFKKFILYTKIIPLKNSSEELISQFRKNTRYEIRRAAKDGVVFTTEPDLMSFVQFYNAFMRSKNCDALDELNYQNISSMKDDIILTRAELNGEVLVMHSYIYDKDAGRVRLLHTASLFRLEDKNKRNLVGRANRYLHYMDMMYFADEGFNIYDMGGYAFNTSDPELRRINDFKDCFGGELLKEGVYISWPLFMIRKMRRLLNKLKNKKC